MRKQYRTEKKYLLNVSEYYILKNILSGIMHKDRNASEKGDYTIKSTYFDCMDNLSYSEKIAGILERKKIRLRTYGTNSPEYVKLEIKNKWNEGVYKETVKIKNRDAQLLLQGNAESLLEYGNETASKVYGLMHQKIWKPVIAIDYEREAYTLPFNQIRVTFDKNLRCSNENLQSMDADRTYFPVIGREYVILEVKYNHFLPEHIKRVLGCASGQAVSVSKYCLARQLLG